MSDQPDFSSVKAIYFDLDDTLCGYWEASKFGLRRAFELHGPEGYTPVEMVQHWAATFREFGSTLKQTGWYPIYLKESEPTRTEQMRLTLLHIGIADDERAKRLSQAYMEERDSALRLFDDAIEVLDKLKAKYPMGLMTNGPADLQRMEIATLGIEKYFDHIFIEGEMGEGKPKPSVFRRAEDAMNASGAELLFVGNSYAHDIQPAIEAGWKTAWIRRPTDVPPSAGPGHHLPEALDEKAAKPDAIIGDLKTLLTLLEV